MNKSEAWEKYQRWVYKLAWDLHKSYPKHLEIEEKISVGYEALTLAVDGYDETVEGTTFMAYSRRVITTNILKAIYKELQASLPRGKKNGERISYGKVIPFFWNDGGDNDELISTFQREVMRASSKHPDQLDRMVFDEAVATMQEDMTDRQKLIFSQHFLEGRDLVDIAKDLGVTKQAVCVKLNKLKNEFPDLKRTKK